VVLNLEEKQVEPPPLKVIIPHYRELDAFNGLEIRAVSFSNLPQDLKHHLAEFFSLVTAFQMRETKRFIAKFETVEGGDILAQVTHPLQLKHFQSFYSSIPTHNENRNKEAQE